MESQIYLISYQGRIYLISYQELCVAASDKFGGSSTVWGAINFKFKHPRHSRFVQRECTNRGSRARLFNAAG